MSRPIQRYFSSLGLVLAAALGGSDAALARVTTVQNGAKTTIDVRLEGLDLSASRMDGQNFVLPQLRGADGHEGVLYRVGAPAIPVVRFLVIGQVRVQTGAETDQVLTATTPVAPVQPSRVKLPGKDQPLAFDAKVYGQDSAYPQQQYSVEPAGSVRGQAQYLVTLFPMRLNPVSGSYSWTENFQVTVEAQGQAKNTGADTYVFVVGNALKGSPSLAEFAAVKSQLGYTVRQLVVGEDVNTPDDIRAALQGIYRDPALNLQHVLVVGDAELVPGHSSGVINGVTDHYYRAIDTDNYATDVNAPDVGVGRVSVKTEAQLAIVLGKFQRYTRGNFQNEGWLEQIGFIATDDRWQVAEGTHNYVINTHTKKSNHTGVFPSNPMVGGDQLYAITHRVPDAKVHEVMNSGRTIINYSGHGSNTSWAGPNVSQANVRSMQDPDALPFVISNACITGNFRIEESFGETWQRHHAGAIMFWGSMDNTYWDEDDVLERAMYDAIFRDNRLNFSDFTGYALSEVWKYYGGAGKSRYYWETYVTFGDPSLNLRTMRTQRLSLDGPDAIPVGMNEVQYTVTNDAGEPVAGARVALTIEGRSAAWTAVTNADGVVTFSAQELAGEPARISAAVDAPNAQLMTKDVDVIAADAPFIGLSSFTINGRDHAAIYAGETINVELNVKNLGLQPTAGGRLRVAGVGGPVQVLQGEVAVPELASGAQSALSAPLTLQVSSAATAQDAVRIEFSWETVEGVSNKFAVTLRVVRAQLDVVGVDYGSELAPGEGGIRPGESGLMYVTIKNSGNDMIKVGEVSASANGGACVDSAEGLLLVRDLGPGDSMRHPLAIDVAINRACRNGDIGALTVAGHYETASGNLTLASAVNFIVGQSSIQNAQFSGALAIPDNAPAVTQVINVASDGVIVDLGVHVKITHTYIGDLIVALVHPDGTRIPLHERAGGSEDNIDRVYGMGGEDLPPLKSLIGKNAMGAWQVEVQDAATGDLGTLDAIELRVKGYF